MERISSFVLWVLENMILARLDEVQEEVLYYHGISGGVGVSKMLKFLR